MLTVQVSKIVPRWCGDGENAETNDGDNDGQQVVATGDQEPVDNRVDNRTSRSLFQVLLDYKLG